jgi:hypothetical protein
MAERRDRKDPGKRAEIAARQAKAVQLKASGATYDQIGRALGTTKVQAYRDIQAALLGSKREIDDNLIALRALEDVRYDDLRRRAYAVLTAEHIVVQHGQIVRDESGNPVKDHEPVLKAIDRLLKIEAQFAVLHGLNADERMVIAFENRAEVEAAHTVEAILAAFAAVELPAEVRMRALEAAQTKLAELTTPVVDAEVVEEVEE